MESGCLKLNAVRKKLIESIKNTNLEAEKAAERNLIAMKMMVLSGIITESEFEFINGEFEKMSKCTKNIEEILEMGSGSNGEA